MKNWAKWLLKLCLTGLALYLLSKKIDWKAIQAIVAKSNFLLLFVALILYILSKVVSAIRLNGLQKQIPIQLSELRNTKLYFIGMFYNLFLPGGIGGDGYKAVWLKRQFNQPTKKIVAALFLDRFFGLAALFLLLFGGLFATSIFQNLPQWAPYLVAALLFLVVPVTYAVVHFVFPTFKLAFWKTLGLSIITQGIQILEAIVIILAIGLSGKIINYLVLFLASSIAAVLPISVGGVGVRELTFVYGNGLLQIEKNQAVAFSLIFFVLNAISSLIGAFLSMEKKEK